MIAQRSSEPDDDVDAGFGARSLFAMLGEDVLRDRRLTDGALRVLGMLRVYALRDGIARAGQATLGADVGKSPRQVYNLLAELVALGYVEEAGRIAQRGRQGPGTRALRPVGWPDYQQRITGNARITGNRLPPKAAISSNPARDYQQPVSEHEEDHEEDRPERDDDMRARSPSSSSGLVVQHGLVDQPTQLIPTVQRPPVTRAAEPLPPEVAAGLSALSDALGESRGSDSLARLLVKLWRSRSPGLTPALYAGAIAACRDEAVSQARASYGAYFTSQLPRFVADRVTPAPKPRPRTDATSAAQRAIEPNGPAWRDQERLIDPDLPLPRAGPATEPSMHLEPVPIVRVAR